MLFCLQGLPLSNKIWVNRITSNKSKSFIQIAFDYLLSICRFYPTYHQKILFYPIVLIGNVKHDFYHHEAHFNFWDTYLKNNPGRSAKLDNRKPKNSPSSLRARLFDPMKNVIKMMQFSVYITNRWAIYSGKYYGLRSSFRWEKAIKTINQPKKKGVFFL